MRRFTSFLLAAVFPVWLAAQDPAVPPAFKTGVELVQIDVSVLDGKRQPVRGLTAADFTVLEDGQSRPIRVFEAVDLPPRASAGPTTTWQAASASAVATNQVGAQDGRLVFILMDRTIPVGQPTLAAKKIATAAVEALGPGDLAALVTTSGGIPQTLTANRERLIAALNRGDWSTGFTPEQEAVPTFGKQDPLSDGRCLCGICVLETVTNIANAVRQTPRRSKVLLFIGNSLIVQAGPRAPSLDVGCDIRLRDARTTMFDALARSHLTVHSLDPAGLVSIGGHTNAGIPGGAQGVNGPAARMLKLQADINEHQNNQGTLRVLPDLTGGRVVLNTNAPELKVPEIFHESEAYYVIGFEPGRSLRDEPRSIKVNVARDDVHVSTTRTVVPSLPPASGRETRSGSALASALAGLLPVAGAPLDVAAAAFAGANGPDAFVSVSVNATSFTGASTGPLPLEFGVSALDQRGRHVASAKQGSTVLPGSNLSTGAIAVLQTHLNLKPGDYELRAAVAHRDSGSASSVFAQLAIPPFADLPLSLSNLILGMRETTEAPADAATPHIPIVPTTQRAFRRGDRVWSFMQVYQGTERRNDLHTVSVRTIVVDDQERLFYDRSLTLAPSEFVNRRADVRIILPLAKLPAGRYVFRIDATLGQRIASRGVPFIVE
jgi:VWFA-related protein